MTVQSLQTRCVDAHPAFSAGRSIINPPVDIRARLDRLRAEIDELVAAEERSLHQARIAARRRRRVLRRSQTPCGVYDALDMQLNQLESLLLAG